MNSTHQPVGLCCVHSMMMLKDDQFNLWVLRMAHCRQCSQDHNYSNSSHFLKCKGTTDLSNYFGMKVVCGTWTMFGHCAFNLQARTLESLR